MDFVMDSLRADWEALLAFSPRLFYGLVILAIFLLAARQAGRLIPHLTRNAHFDSNLRFVQRAVTWLVGAIGVLLALGVMGFQGVAASLLATGGVAAVVLGFAFREIGENFLAGFFLTFSRPFELGDLIKTGDLTGAVRSIELRYVHIRTADACDVYVPSAQIFSEPLYNYTRDGLRRPSFTVGVAYDDEPDQVITLLQDAARSVVGVLRDPAAFVTVKEFSAQYVSYEVFYWIDVNRSGRGIVEIGNDVRVACWRALREGGMTFSTDVSTGVSIHSVPTLEVTGMAGSG